MKTKSIPALITLSAGLIASIAGILAHMDTTKFMIMLLVVLIVFYILGGIVKIVVDIGFKAMTEEGEGETETTEGAQGAEDEIGEEEEEEEEEEEAEQQEE